MLQHTDKTLKHRRWTILKFLKRGRRETYWNRRVRGQRIENHKIPIEQTLQLLHYTIRVYPVFERKYSQADCTFFWQIA